MKRPPINRGLTLVEMMISTAIVGVVGLVIFSMLNIGTILGAKNTAVNVAHQNARTAMLQMTADFHASVSALTLVDVNGNPLPMLKDAQNKDIPNNGPAAGIAFQLWSAGPFRIVASASVGATVVRMKGSKPNVDQRLVIRSHAIEEKITVVTNAGVSGEWNLTLEKPITTAINYDSTDWVTGIITDRCSYIVAPTVPQPAIGFNGSLQWKGPTTKKTFAVLGSDITSEKPFQTPVTAAGAPDERVVAAIDLSTSDSKYSNRGFKSANILLSGQVPVRARLTDQQ